MINLSGYYHFRSGWTNPKKRNSAVGSIEADTTNRRFSFETKVVFASLFCNRITM
jgi:hypothetical protein